MDRPGKNLSKVMFAQSFEAKSTELMNWPCCANQNSSYDSDPKPALSHYSFDIRIKYCSNQKHRNRQQSKKAFCEQRRPYRQGNQCIKFRALKALRKI